MPAKVFHMSHPAVRDLLTTGQVAAVLHKSANTISRWAKTGELPTLGRIAVGRGVYVFDPEVVKEKAMELALGRNRGETLDLDLHGSKAS